MPSTLQINLTTSRDCSIEHKIDLADELFNLCNKPQISAVSYNNKSELITNSIENLKNLTSSLSEEISEHKRNINTIIKRSQFVGTI